MAMSAEHRSKFPALTGNGDVSIWKKNYWVVRKTPNKQKQKYALLSLNELS